MGIPLVNSDDAEMSGNKDVLGPENGENLDDGLEYGEL